MCSLSMGSYVPNLWICVNHGNGLLLSSSTVPSFLVLFQVSSKIFSQFILIWALVIMNYTYKPATELRKSIITLTMQISITCNPKAELCEVFLTSLNVEMMVLDQDSWIYLQKDNLTYFNLCLMGMSGSCHAVRSQRSSVSCSGSLRSKGYKARCLFVCVCVEGTGFCACITLWTIGITKEG